MEILPDSAGIWHKVNPVEIYPGDELFELIDGGAEVFKEYGFEQVLVQKYMDNEDDVVDVEVYEMKDSCAAYGIFSLFTFGTGKKVDSPKEAFEGEDFLLFRKGKYYISLTEINSTDKANQGLSLVAKKIDLLIPEAGKPAFVSAFDKFEILGIVYLKGNLGLNNVWIDNPFDKFKIGEGVYLRTSKYQMVILKYETPDDAQKNYYLLLKALEENSKYKLLRSGDQESLFGEQTNYLKTLQFNNHIFITVTKDEGELNRATEKVKRLLKSEENK